MKSSIPNEMWYAKNMEMILMVEIFVTLPILDSQFLYKENYDGDRKDDPIQSKSSKGNSWKIFLNKS